MFKFSEKERSYLRAQVFCAPTAFFNTISTWKTTFSGPMYKTYTIIFVQEMI